MQPWSRYYHKQVTISSSITISPGYIRFTWLVQYVHNTFLHTKLFWVKMKTISSYMTRTDSAEKDQLNKMIDTYHTLSDSTKTILDKTIDLYQTISDRTLMSHHSSWTQITWLMTMKNMRQWIHHPKEGDIFHHHWKCWKKTTALISATDIYWSMKLVNC